MNGLPMCSRHASDTDNCQDQLFEPLFSRPARSRELLKSASQLHVAADCLPSFIHAKTDKQDPRCGRHTFIARHPQVADPFARRTRRVSDLARLATQAAGGSPAERLMARLGVNRRHRGTPAM